MTYIITIPPGISDKLQTHLFQNQLEQGAFLFAKVNRSQDLVNFQVVEMYQIPSEGWEVQLEVYLEMRDSERAKIMQMARSIECAAIDCHSHPDSGTQVAFSPSDRGGITDFAKYAKWKLPGQPFAAMVWGEQSVDAIAWDGSFVEAQNIEGINISSTPPTFIRPQGSWWPKYKKGWVKGRSYGKR